MIVHCKDGKDRSFQMGSFCYKTGTWAPGKCNHCGHQFQIRNNARELYPQFEQHACEKK